MLRSPWAHDANATGLERASAETGEASGRSSVTRAAEISDFGSTSRDELRARGRALRDQVPLEAHGVWVADPARDPTAVLAEEASERVPELVSLRYARMSESPFAYFRGGAAIMAADLASTPTTGVNVQCGGDAHLLNFGLFASPERRVIFDINDFDETIAGPWEWDLKRLAASAHVAARGNGMDSAKGRQAVVATVRSYARQLDSLARHSTLDVWYSDVDATQVAGRLQTKRRQREVSSALEQADRRTNVRAFSKLTEVRDGRRVFVDMPPVMKHVADATLETVMEFLAHYRDSLSPDHAHLLNQFRFVDAARRVVGVGSVGTRCYVLLGQGRADLDPLVLQVKEAQESVLARHVGPSTWTHHGQRVVEGQRLMQAASDPFLGWSSDPTGRHYYVRQLWDMKGSADLASLSPGDLTQYSILCAATLARAHARAVDPAVLAGYCGGGNTLANAIAGFSESYAAQSERDHALLVEALRADAASTRAEHGQASGRAVASAPARAPDPSAGSEPPGAQP
jgi:uncharacterized protein (DUF2252 family)